MQSKIVSLPKHRAGQRREGRLIRHFSVQPQYVLQCKVIQTRPTGKKSGMVVLTYSYARVYEYMTYSHARVQPSFGTCEGLVSGSLGISKFAGAQIPYMKWYNMEGFCYSWIYRTHRYRKPTVYEFNNCSVPIKTLIFSRFQKEETFCEGLNDKKQFLLSLK